MSATFEAIKRRRLSDDVSAQIQMRIASGELRSGDKLPPERELAERFGVSRGAVREALRTLERTGLVSLQAGSRGGAFIGHGNPGLIGDSFRNLYLLGSVSLDDLTEARQWLESTVVRMVAERATPEDLAALEANVDEAERLFRAGRFDAKIDVHIEFHNLLARATRNPVIIMLMGALMDVMRDFAHARRWRTQRPDHQGAPPAARSFAQARCGGRRGGHGRASRQPAPALPRSRAAAAVCQEDELTSATLS